MRNALAIIAIASLAASGCGGPSSAADNCREYASEIQGLMDRDAPSDEIAEFLEATEEKVARWIVDDPEPELCADAIFGALFDSAIDDLQAELETEFGK